MALLPQTASFADQLLLFLVARTRAEALVLALVSAVGGVAWMMAIGQGGHPVLIGGPYVVASVYLPALVVVLRHPNEGRVPAFLEERLRTLPGWLRGVAPPHDATTPITAD
jgi:hypothetical protein